MMDLTTAVMSVAGVILVWFSMLDLHRITSGRASWRYIIASSAMLGLLWGLWFALVLQP